MKEEYKVEKIWTHNRNICVVIMSRQGHRCGYVGITPDHPLYGEDISSKPEILQDLREPLMHSAAGKRGIVDIFIFVSGDGVRVADFFDVHGSTTYSDGKSNYPITSWIIKKWNSRSGATFYYNPWWFGYDCAHAGDGTDLSAIEPNLREIYEKYPIPGAILRSHEFCVKECESLSNQLEEIYDIN